MSVRTRLPHTAMMRSIQGKIEQYSNPSVVIRYMRYDTLFSSALDSTGGFNL